MRRGAHGLRLVIFVFFGFRASSGHGPPVTFPLGNVPFAWKGTNITKVEKEDKAHPGDCEESRDQASDSEDLQT